MPYNNQNSGRPQYNNPQRFQNGNTGAQQPRASTGSRFSANGTQSDGVMMINEKMGKFLRTRYWNRCLCIDIGTFAPGMTLDYNTIRGAQVFSQAFSFTAIFELKEICEDIIRSIKETNHFESTAIHATMKKDSIIEISNGSNIGMPTGIYLVVYKNVDSGNRSNTYDSYPFDKVKVMRNYDHATGSSMEDINAVGELKKFTVMLDEAARAFTMAQSHAIKEASKSDKMGMLNALAAVGRGLGIDIGDDVAAGTRVTGQASSQRQSQNPQNFRRQSQPGQWGRPNGSGNGNYAQNRFNGGSQSNYQKTQAAMASLTDEPVDINIDAATLQQVDMSKFA